MVIKRIVPLSLGRIHGAIMGGIGLIFGIFAALGFAIAGMVTDKPAMIGVGVVILVLIPLFYGGIGFLVGALWALIYNLFAKLVGGIEVETE